MKKILLSGATGYIGSHLLKALETEHFSVRCMARRPGILKSQVIDGVEVVAGDVFDPASLDAAMKDVSVTFYLIHSMADVGDFESKDQVAALNFANAAKKNGVERIIYLGGLANGNETLSPHLRSRQQVGDILRAHGPQIIEFRASVIIGAGSLSFEMIRALTERLPIMITPKWVSQRAQPIAVDDVISYLIGAIQLGLTENRIFEIGGKDQLSYGDIMREYARQRGLKRYMIAVPFLTPRLSSLWLGLVTPLYARVGRKLVESLIHRTVVENADATEVFGILPRSAADAIRDALRAEDSEMAHTHWFNALSSSLIEKNWGGVRFGSRIVDTRSITVPVGTARAFEPIQLIGGRNGWYYATWLWKLRGWFDLLFGGVGTRRGRSHSRLLRKGDVIDWWRIEEVKPGTFLRLAAEMRVPGRAWLQFEVVEISGGSKITQTAIYDPVGLWGLVYWYALYPIHQLIFQGMLNEIGRRAEVNR